MTLSGKLTLLMDEAKETLSRLVRMHGETEVSKFGYIKVISLKNDKINYEINGHHILEISQNELIDYNGYLYSAEAMNVEDFLEFVDKLVLKYSN